MYVDAKMRPVETVSGIRGGGMRKSSGGEWIQVWYIWYIVRTFINATMYPHTAHNKIKI
jgi:hypothetical protein